MKKIYLIAYRLNKKGFVFLARVINFFVRSIFNAHIDLNIEIKKSIQFPHQGQGVVINKGTSIGENVKIMHNVTLGGDFSRTRIFRGKIVNSPQIGNDVFIGPGTIIVGPVSIGDGARISGNCFINFDVSKHTIVILDRKSLFIKNVDKGDENP